MFIPLKHLFVPVFFSSDAAGLVKGLNPWLVSPNITLTAEGCEINFTQINWE